MKAVQRFPFYLVAKEFGLPIEEVMEWPVSKTMEHFYFLKEWYKMRYGDPEDMDDNIGGQTSTPNVPKMPSKARKHMPSDQKARMDSMRKQGTQLKPGRGASGHEYKFKKTDS